MKTIIKIEIVVLVLLLLAGGALFAMDAGVLELLKEPVVIEYEPQPFGADVPEEEIVPEQPQPAAEEEITFPEPQSAGLSREIDARKYFVYDIRTGEYLKKQGDETEKLYPASITKLLTSYVILQHADPEETVVAGDALDLVPEDSSVAKIEEGDVLTVEQLIAALMLPSGNDAAQIAAAMVGRRLADDETLSAEAAVEVFVEEMNDQAQALGMVNSHFVTPDGFHRDNHYTTMDDLVIICQKVLAEPVILKYASRAKDTIVLPDRNLELKNTNLLLYPESEFYMPNAIGLKTGYTDPAGSCLVTVFFEGDRILLTGVFGATPHTDDRYLDTLAIYNSI